MIDLPLMTDADARRRAHAVVLITSMRGNLAALEHFLANAPSLSGNYWASVLEDADLAVIRAVRAATTLGSSNLGDPGGRSRR